MKALRQGCPPVLGSRLSAKGTRPSYQIIFGERRCSGVDVPKARPVDETVATASFDVAHATVTPAIVAPFWSLTVADSCVVSPSEAKLRLASEMVIEVATGVGVGVGVVGVVGESPPPQLHNNSGNNTEPNPTVFFMP